MRYNYFVSFSRAIDGKTYFSNNGISLDNMVTSFEDILEFEKILHSRFTGTCRVLHYQLLNVNQDDQEQENYFAR